MLYSEYQEQNKDGAENHDIGFYPHRYFLHYWGNLQGEPANVKFNVPHTRKDIMNKVHKKLKEMNDGKKLRKIDFDLISMSHWSSHDVKSIIINN